MPIFSLVLGMIISAVSGTKINYVYIALFLGVVFSFVFVVAKRIEGPDNFNLWKRGILLSFILIVLGMSIFSHEANRTYFLTQFNGLNVTLNGTVVFSENRGKDLYNLTLLVREGQNHILKKPEKVLVKIYGELEDFQDLVGRDIQIRGALEIPNPARNPKCFDYQKYLRTKGIATIVNVNPRFIEYQGLRTGTFSLGWRSLHNISAIKQEFLNTISQKISPQGMALVKGMLFGDKSDIDPELILEFQRNSTAHILAVSGLHVGIIYGFLTLLFRKHNSLVIDLFILLVLGIYAVMSFLAPSVIRAVFMIGIHIAAKRFHFRYDLLSATVFTAGIILLINPLMLLNAGFQLSYTALLTMSFFIPYLHHHCSLKLLKPFLPLMAIQVGLIPIIAFHFNHLSFVGIIANIPIIFLAGLIIPILIILFPLHLLLNGMLIDTLATSSDWLFQAIIFMNETLYFQGRFSTLTPSPPFCLIGFFYLGLFFLTSELTALWKERKQFAKILGSFILIAALLVWAGFLLEDDFQDIGIIFLDVGQGDCLFIETPSGKTAMIDSGGSASYDVGRKTLLPFLLKNGHSKLDLAIVTHLHQDHYGGFKTLSQEIPIGGLVLYGGYQSEKDKIVSESGFKSKDLIFSEKGVTIKLDNRVSIEVLCPEAWTKDDKYNPEDENQMSLVLMVIYDGVKILMTGDIDKEGEKNVVNSTYKIQDLNCDILKVPHHGSKYSMSEFFLNHTSPQCAVIQVGKNNFGHPSSAVLEKCLEKDIMVFRNDLQGAIGIKIENRETQNLWVKTMITNAL